MISWKQREFANITQRENQLLYLARIFNIDPFIIQLLSTKGFYSEEKISNFFFPTTKNMHNPFLMKDLKKAVIRIIQAIQRKESILIFGDYDVDGITSTALLYNALSFFKGNVSFQIPLREDGYGLSLQTIEKMNEQTRPSLIITVDNGSSSLEAIKRCNELGIEVIVTDHHEILNEHPPCFAFVNPKRSDDTYPFSQLSGAGVAFKVVQGLFELSAYSWEKYLWNYIELAALGTIADMMPLSDENRAIATLGIQKLNTQPSSFFKELFRQLKLPYVKSTDISFKVAPILNSSGRIGNPNDAVQLIIQSHSQRQGILTLIEINNMRKTLTEEQFKLADFQVMNERLFEKAILVVNNDFDDGIIGIIAARLSNKYLKPSIVISKEGKASCRSAPNSTFSIVNAIKQCGHLLKRYGGHQSAAGFSIDVENIEAFKEAVELVAQQEPAPKIVVEYDALLKMDQFPLYLIDELDLLEPFGNGNHKPVFFSPQTPMQDLKFFGNENQYFKFPIQTFEAISFAKGQELYEHRHRQSMDFLYTVDAKDRFLIQDFSTNQMKKSFLEAM